MLINTAIEEKNLLSGLANVLSTNGWSTVSNFTRYSFSADMCKPVIAKGTLSNDTSTFTVNIPKDIADPTQLYVYGNGTLNVARYTKTEDQSGIKLTFTGTNNATPMEVMVMYSGVRKGDTVEIHFAEHQIVLSGSGSLFGIATHGVMQKKASDIPAPPLLAYVPNTMPSWTYGTSMLLDDEMLTWLGNNKRQFTDRNRLYFYQLDTIMTNVPLLLTHTIPWQTTVDLKRAALDIEVVTAMWDLDVNNQLNFQVTQAQQENYQSPIVESALRIPQADQPVEFFGQTIRETNWWEDSLIRISGSINSVSAMLILNVDTAPLWEKNAAPSIPVYMGAVDMQLGQNYNGAHKNSALFCGTAVTSNATTLDQALKNSEKFNFSDPSSQTSQPLQPLMKNYLIHPSNGIDSIMIQRNKYGSRYQSHYLQWNTAPDQMLPSRESDNGGQYPRAWRNAENPAYGYQFNPSRYSGKVHASLAQVIHPENGVFGSLAGIILLNPLSLEDGDELEVVVPCSTQSSVYTYQLTEAISPLTKRPSTAYRPAAIGILQTI